MKHDDPRLAWDITPLQLQARLAAGDLCLIDVRELDEWQAGYIAGAQHIPLSELPGALGRLDPQAEIVLYCKRGSRSLQALAYLQKAGFAHLQNLAGGIIAWGEEIDAALLP